MNAMTAAHKTLPFNTRVKVVNLENGLEIVVRINDRGPFVEGRIIDLSRRAAERLGLLENGTARVRLIALETKGARHAAGENSAHTENFSVQVGAFKDPNNAGQLKQEIENSRTEPYLKEGEEYFRVLVGNYSNFEDALKRMDELRTRGYAGAFVIAD